MTKEEQIKPKEFLKYAEENYKECIDKNSKKDLINIYGCINKGFCSQVDELYNYLEKEFEPKIKNLFKKKYQYILKLLDNSENIIHLYDSRNELEHDYRVKPYEKIEQDIKDLRNFIESVQEVMVSPPKKEKEKINAILKDVIKKSRGGKRSNYFLEIKKFINHYPKDPFLLTQEDSHKYLNNMKLKHTDSTIASTNTALGFLFKKILLKKEYKLHTGFSKKKLKTRKGKKYDEIKRILKKMKSPKKRLYLLFAWHHALRVSDMVKLRIEDLSGIDLSDEIRAELERYLKGRRMGYVFLNSLGNKILKRTIQNEFKDSFPQDEEYLPLLDIKQIGLGKSKLKREQIITREELRKLIQASSGDKNKGVIYFIYEFGVGECQFVEISREDIIFRAQKIKLNKTKNYPTYIKKISRYAMKKLKDYSDTHTRKNGKIFMRERMIQRILEEAREKSGIKKKVDYRILSNSLKASFLK